jgi:hypothetical protein
MCEDCRPNPQRSGETNADQFKRESAILFLILSPFIGIMIACFLFAIFG